MRSNATALKVLVACTVFATVLLLPVLIEAAVFKIDKMRMIPLLDGSPELAASGNILISSSSPYQLLRSRWNYNVKVYV